MTNQCLIHKWQRILKIDDWKITTERIHPEQVIHNGEKYFIGIVRDWDNQKGIIYHDVDLYEEAIVHELLHVRYPNKDEDWINEKTKKLLDE
tara:strand:- start:68937 stop:69212 length:276 start_codon:yes stop_codon:yes gene_type:complete